jgi:hypothetical protein
VFSSCAFDVLVGGIVVKCPAGFHNDGIMRLNLVCHGKREDTINHAND